MTLIQFAWSLIAADVLLFLIWLYATLVPSGGSDAAGRGLGQAFTLALGIYILVMSALLLVQWPPLTVLTVILAALPLGVAGYGIFRWLRNR